MGKILDKVLDKATVEFFREHGYISGIPVLAPQDAALYRKQLEDHEARTGGAISGDSRYKNHLLFPWSNKLMRTPAVLDVVQDLLGPNLLCFSTTLFIKEPASPGFVSWHQDGTYTGIVPNDDLTVWIALADASEEAGCMQVIPGSHKLGQLPHQDTHAADNLLSRGQQVSQEIDTGKAVGMPLKLGEMSVHHALLLHGSGANNGGDRRIGYTARYMPTHFRQARETGFSASLVRGVDEHHNWRKEPVPQFEGDPEATAFHQQAMHSVHQVLFKGAGDKAQF